MQNVDYVRTNTGRKKRGGEPTAKKGEKAKNDTSARNRTFIKTHASAIDTQLRRKG